MKYYRPIIAIGIILSLINISTTCEYAHAIELQRPNVHKVFSQEEEAKIQALKSLGTKDVFDRLKSSDFLINKDLTYKAVYIAYTNRRAEAISLAQGYLMSPLIEFIDGRVVTHSREFNTAKRIFEVFPDEAIISLRTFYYRSNGVTRGNIILASGGIAGGPSVNEMFVQALDDKSEAEKETPNILGKPLRVCDIAYNQLVLRHSIRDVLRTISTANKIETRDYHINKLKDLI